jgi:hypothetical protein
MHQTSFHPIWSSFAMSSGSIWQSVFISRFTTDCSPLATAASSEYVGLRGNAVAFTGQ